MHTILISTYIFINVCSSKIQFHPVHSAIGVRTHSYELYQASTHTAAEPLTPISMLDSDLYT